MSRILLTLSVQTQQTQQQQQHTPVQPDYRLLQQFLRTFHDICNVAIMRATAETAQASNLGRQWRTALYL